MNVCAEIFLISIHMAVETCQLIRSDKGHSFRRMLFVLMVPSCVCVVFEMHLIDHDDKKSWKKNFVSCLSIFLNFQKKPGYSTEFLFMTVMIYFQENDEIFFQQRKNCLGNFLISNESRAIE